MQRGAARGVVMGRLVRLVAVVHIGRWLPRASIQPRECRTRGRILKSTVIYIYSSIDMVATANVR